MGKVLIKTVVGGQYYLAPGKGTTRNKAEAFHYDADYARNYAGPENLEPVEDKVLIQYNGDGRFYLERGYGRTNIRAEAHQYDRDDAEVIAASEDSKIVEIEPVQTDAEKIAWLEAKVNEFAADILEKENKIADLRENIEFLRKDKREITERLRQAEAKIVNLPFLLNTAVQETLRRVA